MKIFKINILLLLIYVSYTALSQSNINTTYIVSMPKCITYMSYNVTLEENNIAIKPHKFNFINDSSVIVLKQITSVIKRKSLGILPNSLVILSNNKKYRFKFSSKSKRDSFFDEIKSKL